MDAKYSINSSYGERGSGKDADRQRSLASLASHGPRPAQPLYSSLHASVWSTDVKWTSPSISETEIESSSPTSKAVYELEQRDKTQIGMIITMDMAEPKNALGMAELDIDRVMTDLSDMGIIEAMGVLAYSLTDHGRQYVEDRLYEASRPWLERAKACFTSPAVIGGIAGAIISLIVNKSSGDTILNSGCALASGWPRVWLAGRDKPWPFSACSCTRPVGRPLPQLVRVHNSADSGTIDQPAVCSIAGRVNFITTSLAATSLARSELLEYGCSFIHLTNRKKCVSSTQNEPEAETSLLDVHRAELHSL